jgi:DNA-binding NarL/FixJ family response regulator
MTNDQFLLGQDDSTDRRIRILIADDHKLLREVIRLYLERVEDIVVIDEAPELNAALESAGRSRPDVVIMNGDLPPIDSAHASAIFRQNGFTASILIVTVQLEPSLLQRSFLQGANGFMSKDEIDEHIVEAVRHVHRGERYLSPKAADLYSKIQE